MVMYFYIVIVVHKIMRFVCLTHDTPGVVDGSNEKANQVEMLDGQFPWAWLVADFSEPSTVLRLNQGICYA